MIFNSKSETAFFSIMETNTEDFVNKCILFDRAWSYFQFRTGYMHAFWTINVFPFHQDVEKFADQNLRSVSTYVVKQQWK